MYEVRFMQKTKTRRISTWGTNQSVYHLHTWAAFSLASEARSTSLEHVRAHVSTRLDRGQTSGGSCVLYYLHIEGKCSNPTLSDADCPSDRRMPELLASP